MKKDDPPNSDEISKNIPAYLALQGVEAEPNSHASPAMLDLLLDSPLAEARSSSVHALKMLMGANDPLARWGVMYFLLHRPFHLYLKGLLKELQDADQPEEVRRFASALSRSDWLTHPYTSISLIRTFARVRFLIYLVAVLYSSPVQPPPQ